MKNIEGYEVRSYMKDYERRDISNSHLYRGVTEDGLVRYDDVIDELVRRTHLPRWICSKVYDGWQTILLDIGLTDKLNN